MHLSIVTAKSPTDDHANPVLMRAFSSISLAMNARPYQRFDAWPVPERIRAHGCHRAFALPDAHVYGACTAHQRSLPYGFVRKAHQIDFEFCKSIATLPVALRRIHVEKHALSRHNHHRLDVLNHAGISLLTIIDGHQMASGRIAALSTSKSIRPFSSTSNRSLQNLLRSTARGVENHGARFHRDEGLLRSCVKLGDAFEREVVRFGRPEVNTIRAGPH